MKNSLLSCSLVVKKTSILTKLHYFMDRKVNKMLFIPTFHEKITAPMLTFCNKPPFSKKDLPSSLYSLKKTSILSKTLCSHVIFFFKLVMKKHPAVMPIFGQEKYRFCQNYTILWAKKVNRMAFFSDFSQKNNFCHAHIL